MTKIGDRIEARQRMEWPGMIFGHSINPALNDPIEDWRHALLAELETPEARIALVLEWFRYGLIDEGQVAYWMYVFGLKHE